MLKMLLKKLLLYTILRCQRLKLELNSSKNITLITITELNSAKQNEVANISVRCCFI